MLNTKRILIAAFALTATLTPHAQTPAPTSVPTPAPSPVAAPPPPVQLTAGEPVTGTETNGETMTIDGVVQAFLPGDWTPEAIRPFLQIPNGRAREPHGQAAR